MQLGKPTLFYRTPLFWLAMLLGPVVSALLYLILQGVPANIDIPVSQWELLLWLVLLYPLLEEIVFRGLLQTRLLETAWGKKELASITLANVVTSLLFGTVHFINHPPHWALMVFVPSLVFGWFRDRHHTILPAVILHCWYNLSYFSIFGLPTN